MSFEDELEKAARERAEAQRQAQDRESEAAARPARYAVVASKAYAALVEGEVEQFTLVREDAIESALAASTIETVVYFESYYFSDRPESVYVDSRGGFHLIKGSPYRRPAKRFESFDYEQTIGDGPYYDKLRKPLRFKYERVNGRRVLRDDAYALSHYLRNYPPVGPEQFGAYAAKCVVENLEAINKGRSR